MYTHLKIRERERENRMQNARAVTRKQPHFEADEHHWRRSDYDLSEIM